MSSPSTATRCPCLGSVVSGLYEPRLLLLPPCRAARRLLPAGSCARRWTWWREREAAWAGQPYSWGNLSWRPMRREQEKEERGELKRGGEEGWERMAGRRAAAAESWDGCNLKERNKETVIVKTLKHWPVSHLYLLWLTCSCSHWRLHATDSLWETLNILTVLVLHSCERTSQKTHRRVQVNVEKSFLMSFLPCVSDSSHTRASKWMHFHVPWVYSVLLFILSLWALYNL